MALTVLHVVAFYFVIWWVAFMATLPWGVRRDDSSEVLGADPGAPVETHLARKVLAASVLAAAATGGLMIFKRMGFGGRAEMLLIP